MIMDDTVYGFCSVFELPKCSRILAIKADAKLIAGMPADLDLERLDELHAYKGESALPAVGGTLKSTQAHTYIQKSNIDSFSA